MLNGMSSPRAGASCALLAEKLYVDEGDMRVIVDQLGLDPDVDVPYEWLGHVHDILARRGERTLPQIWMPPGSERPRLANPKDGPTGEVIWPPL